jgi:hypothetical protein
LTKGKSPGRSCSRRTQATISKVKNLIERDPQQSVGALSSFLKETRHRFNNLRTNPTQFDGMLLQMDNARPHTAEHTQDYLAAMGLRLIYQSPYSPDLNL